MGDWTTYSLADFVPFLREVYLGHFVELNELARPAHLLAAPVGVFVLALALRGRGRALGALSAAVWVWVGWLYHLQVYQTYNWAGRYFAWAFFGQAGVLVLVALLGGLVRPGGRRSLDLAGWVGVGLVAVGAAAYPLLPLVVDRPWRSAEFFGIAPNPTVVATLGLALTGRHTRWEILVVPLLWCGVTGATSWVLGATTGIVTAGAGGVALAAATWRALAGPE